MLNDKSLINYAETSLYKIFLFVFLSACKIVNDLINILGDSVMAHEVREKDRSHKWLIYCMFCETPLSPANQ